MEKVVTDTQPGQLQYISLSTWAVLSAQIVASGKLLREFIIENLFFDAVCLQSWSYADTKAVQEREVKWELQIV